MAFGHEIVAGWLRQIYEFLTSGSLKVNTTPDPAVLTALENIESSVSSKIVRVNNSPNLTTSLSYYPSLPDGKNLYTVSCMGTTSEGVESYTITITYSDNLVDGSKLLSVTTS